MVRKICLKFNWLIILMLMFFPRVSMAFNSDTRCQLLKDAISICPENLRVYLTDNFVNVHSGIHFADRHEHSNFSIRPSEIESLYQSLITALNNNNINAYNTTHQFGVIACFIAETIAPESYKYYLPERIVYNGFEEVVDVKQNISFILRNYRETYRHSSAKGDRDLLYNAAVNQIVNYWISIWKAGGQDIGVPSPQGTMIAHQVFSGHISSGRS